MQTILPAQTNLMLRRTLVIAMPIWFGVIGIVVLFRISDSLQHNRACREFASRAEEEGIGCWLFSLETTHQNMLIRPEELLRQIVPRYDWIEISGNGQRLSPEAEQRLRLLDGVRWISLSKVMITSSLASSLADIAELETVKIDLGCDLSQLQIDHVEEGVARLSEIRLDCRDSNDIAAFSQLSICRSVEAVFIRTSDPSSDVTKVLRSCSSVKRLCIDEYCVQSTSLVIDNASSLERLEVSFIEYNNEPRRIVLRNLGSLKVANFHGVNGGRLTIESHDCDLLQEVAIHGIRNLEPTHSVVLGLSSKAKLWSTDVVVERNNSQYKIESD